MSGGAYFTNSKRSELAELNAELNSKEKDVVKDAVKKVIAAMTVGKDVSSLFSDVLKAMVTPDLELKKLVYLYLMNYAKAQPELAILAVNAFVKDTKDSNPLIRALAIRTMSSIRVQEIVIYLVEPLRKAVKDEDPYVRKTAAVSIAKLYDVDQELVVEQGFLDDLKDLLGDPNPMVVANAIASLGEVQQISADAFQMDQPTASKLLAALNECTEWGQIYILDALANYSPQDGKEAEDVVDRVMARLSHANSGVVLSSCKVILHMLDFVQDPDYITMVAKQKLAPSLVTLLSAAEPEVQYVALRNIILVLQKMPTLLAEKDIRVFICKYNDPIYVKMEKLEIMILLANPTNYVQVLQELKDSAQEVDVDFVRKAVRAIGRCAIKLEEAADRCVSALMELIQTKVTYVVQEAIVVVKDIFRKYPNRYESVIGQLCENLESLDEPDAKASLFWIIGEYADRIDNAAEILDAFADTFTEEPADVQLQFLTAVVKLFLCAPDESQELMRKILTASTQSDNPDLRDRGYVYWRLLSADPTTAREVVLAEKPVISSEAPVVDPAVLPTLLQNIASLASVYHKAPETFVSKLKAAVVKTGQAGVSDDNLEDAVRRVHIRNEDEEGPVRESSNTLVDDILGGSAPAPAYTAPVGGTGLEDLLGMGAPAAPAAAAPSGGMGMGMGMGMGGLDLLSAPVAPAAAAAPAPTVVPVQATASQVLMLPAEQGDGMEIKGSFARSGTNIVMNITVNNKSGGTLSGFQIQFNQNSFGLGPRSTKMDINSVLPHASAACQVVLVPTPALAAPKEKPITRQLQVAVKNNVKVYFFSTQISLDALSVDVRLDRAGFLGQWRAIPDTAEQNHALNIRDSAPEAVMRKLESKNCFHVARRQDAGHEMLYHSIKLYNEVVVLVEVTLTAGSPSASLCVKSSQPQYSAAVASYLDEVLSQ